MVKEDEHRWGRRGKLSETDVHRIDSLTKANLFEALRDRANPKLTLSKLSETDVHRIDSRFAAVPKTPDCPRQDWAHKWQQIRGETVGGESTIVPRADFLELTQSMGRFANVR